jgi:hypothetical protein
MGHRLVGMAIDEHAHGLERSLSLFLLRQCRADKHEPVVARVRRVSNQIIEVRHGRLGLAVPHVEDAHHLARL